MVSNLRALGEFSPADDPPVEALRPLPIRHGPGALMAAHPKPILGGLTVLLVLGSWQLFAAWHIVDPAFVSSPSQIATSAESYITSPAFARDAAASGTDFIIGFALAVIIGILVGFAVGWFKYVSYALDYLISLAYSAPRIALVPILLVWFGIGARAEVATVFLMAVFPMIINTAAGVRTVDRTLVELARSFNASEITILRTVVFPAAVPSMLSGVRLAIGVGLIGVVVAEFTAASKGIGYMMETAANSFQTARVFVGLVVIALAGLVLTELARRVEQHFDRWRVEQE